MEEEAEYIQTQNKTRQDYKVGKIVSPVVVVLRKRSTIGIIFLLFFSIVVPVLIYYFVVDKGTFTQEGGYTCSIDKTYRVPCGKPNASIDYCDSIHCCFDNSTKLCFHYLPSKYYYYLEDTKYQPSIKETPFNRSMLGDISFTVNDIDENNVEIVLHASSINISSQNLTNKNYFYNVNKTHFYVELFRNDDNQTLLLTTTKGPTILSERYWEWSFQLTDRYLFGLGQTLIDLDENSTLTKVVYGNNKDHNTLPVFMAYINGSYHGLIVRHSGPLQVTVLPSKLVLLKSLAGEKISLQVSVGPTVKEVMRQQRKDHQISVELETLGVHICREGTSINFNSILSGYRRELSDLESADIRFQYDSDCIHENLVPSLMNNDEDTNIAAIQEVINTMMNSGHTFVLTLPPHVLDGSSFYDSTRDLTVFYQTIKTDQTVDYKGKFLGSSVVYPYFGHSSIDRYVEAYVNELNKFFGESKPQNYILGYNWPDDSYKMEDAEDDFQYLSEELKAAMSGTLPWNVTSNDQKHIFHHVDYASLQIEKLKHVLGTETSFITASHNFDITEPVILQNIDISWTNFKNAIVTTISNSIFGYPLTGIPVCGSTVNFNSSHESLCMRWYLMASTAPIFRISSDSPRRDPNSLAALTTKTSGNKARDAIDFRYSLRYYFYTVLNNNEPLMRPMFYDFSDDNETFSLVEQYMVGGAILVAQPTLPDQTQIKVYLPKSVGTWYEFWGGQSYSYSTRKTSWLTLPIVETDWVAFIPEGVIIPFTETVDENTETINLIVALNEAKNLSIGSLKCGKESSFSFTSTNEELIITKDGSEETKTFTLNKISVYKTSNVFSFKLDNQKLDSSSLPYTYKY